MKTLTLRDGAQMPALGLGTWKSGEDEVYDAVRVALQAGYRHIDCAAIYGNEARVGRALEDAMAAGDVTRESLWVTSKLWNDAHRADQVRGALEQTLSDLRLERLDLYLIHWPIAQVEEVHFPSSREEFLTPEQAPLEETWEAMLAAREAGLTRSVGVSNFTAAHIDRVREAVGETPAVNQVERHPYLRQSGLMEAMAARGVVVTAYSPLGSGDRAEEMKGEDEPSLLEDEVVGGIAAAHETSAAQVLLAWAVATGTAVIPKSTTPSHIRENLAAANLTLSAEEVAALDALDRGFRYVDGRFWCGEDSPYTLSYLWGE